MSTISWVSINQQNNEGDKKSEDTEGWNEYKRSMNNHGKNGYTSKKQGGRE